MQAHGNCTAVLQKPAVPSRRHDWRRRAPFGIMAVRGLLGPAGPAKIEEVTLMRPFHGNL